MSLRSSTQLQQAPDLYAGDIVEVWSKAHCEMTMGLRGKVLRIDADGNASIKFDSIEDDKLIMRDQLWTLIIVHKAALFKHVIVKWTM